MKLLSYDEDRVGRLDGQDVVDLTPLVAGPPTGLSPMRRLISAWPDLATRARSFEGQRTHLKDVTVCMPVPDPTKILAAPVNFADHQAEMSVDSHVSSLGLFLKSPSSLLEPDGVVQLPYIDRRFDQEGELALVIGRRAHRLKRAAFQHVFGYTGLLDITMRGGEDRSTRKSFSTFTPCGPWIVTGDEFGDPDNTALSCSVNGEVRQRASTSDLIWGIERLVTYASWISPLHPGDIITTGTPQGVGELVAGDRVTLDIDGLGGTLRVTVAADEAVESHTDGKDRGPKPPPSTRPGR